jgi:hypothetical protein
MGYIYKITNTIIGISIHESTQGRIKAHLAGRGNIASVSEKTIFNWRKRFGWDR